MQVRLLGPLSVVEGEQTVALGGPKERSVLAVLALHAGYVVSESRLIEAVWGEDPPRTASKTLQNYIFRLRKAMGQSPRSEKGVLGIETRPPGYVLLSGAEGVDVVWAAKLVDSARQFARASDYESADRLLTEAAGLWRGAPLEEFADRPFADGAVARLEELRLTMIEEHVETALVLGRHNEAVAELEALVAAHPLRERFWGQLMLALYRSDRQADALRAFQRARETLVEELGIEPGRALYDLERAVLAQDPSLDLPPGPQPAEVGRSTDKAPPGPARRSASLGNLPLQVTSFVGRDEEVGDIADELERARVVTLIGPGGVGKTRLALEVAGATLGRYPDGAWVCRLAPIEDGETAWRAVATTLSVQTPVGHGVLESLVNSLRARRLLLVLDNAEHLVDRVAALVQAIVRSAPDVGVLVTSRAPLAIGGELVWQVAPLSAPSADDPVSPLEMLRHPAVVLFADRARLAQPRFSLTATNAEAVREICQRLDGIPLALELAAARVGSLNPAEIAERLDRPFALLTRSRETGMGPQRTLRDMVDWSYGLLDAAEQRLFNRLAVFAGGLTLGAAECVCSGEPVARDDVAALLADLADKSMLVCDHSDSSTRYRLLETLREYGQERLGAAGEAAALLQRHAEYFVKLAEAAEPALRGPDEARWIDQLDEDFYNLRAAHAWAISRGDADKALRLVTSLHNFAMWSMRYEVAAWAASSMIMEGAATHPLLPTALGSAAYGALAAGAFQEAKCLAARGLDAERAPGAAPSWLARNALAHLAVFELRFDDALDLVNDTIRLAAAEDNRYQLVYGHWVKASVLSAMGDDVGALQIAEEALASARRLGNPTAIAWSLHEMGREYRDKDPARAIALFDESARTALSVNNRLAAGMARREATAVRAIDHPEQALRAYLQQIQHWYRAGDWWNQWITLRKLAVLLVQLGEAEPAAVLHAAATAAHPSRPQTSGHVERLALLEDVLGPERFASATAKGEAMRTDDVLAFATTVIEELLARSEV